MKNKLLEIINHYGIDNQQRKIQEEVFELQNAIIEYECFKLANEKSDVELFDLKTFKEHIEEEIADVCVLLQQFCNKYKLNVSKIGNIQWEKVDRQIERIKNETDNTMVE